MLDAFVFLHHQLVQVLLDIIRHLSHVFAVFQLQCLDVVREVVGGGELSLELLAPFGQESQGLGVRDFDVMRVYLLF